MQSSNTPIITAECTWWNRTLEYDSDQSNSIVYVEGNQTLQVQTLPSILISSKKMDNKQKLVKLDEPECRMFENEELVGKLCLMFDQNTEERLPYPSSIGRDGDI
jgi:hypothetical protein